MITITGTFESLIGSTTGSVAFELANFGTDVPRVSGTGVLTSIKTTSAVGSTFSVTLFANNAITPANTYYIVTFFDANGNAASQAPYTLNATADISTLSPIAALPTVNQSAILANPNGQQTISTWQLNVVSLGLLGGTSGTTQLLPVGVAGGAWTFRNTTDNVVGQATTDTLTNKTLTTPVINGSGGQLTLPAGPDTLVGRATTDTLTNKTLTSPAITNPSTTGTDSGVETLTNKTLSSPTINTPTLNGSGGQLTLPAGPDTLVGRATTDTLQNKTLTGASSGNSVQLLTKTDNSGALTGNSSAQSVFSYAMPANSMQAGKGIRIRTFMQQGGTTNAAVMAFNFGSRNVGIGTFSSTGLLTGQWEILVFNKAGVTNAQIITVNGFVGTTAFNTVDTGSTVDTTAGVTITITFNVANTTTMTPILFVVEQIQ